jgi:hypothetical protein
MPLAPLASALPSVQSEGVAGEHAAAIFATMTPGQKQFAEHYAFNGKIRTSSILAGFFPDYGHQLLKRKDVQLAIEYWRAVYAEKSLYTPEKLIRQWSQMASIDLTEYVNDDYSLKPLSELSEEQRKSLGAALVGLEVTRRAGKPSAKAKLAKIEALENLGKLLHLYGEEQRQGEGLTLNITLGQQLRLGHSEGHAEASEADVGPFRVRLPGREQEGAC